MKKVRLVLLDSQGVTVLDVVLSETEAVRELTNYFAAQISEDLCGSAYFERPDEDAL